MVTEASLRASVLEAPTTCGEIVWRADGYWWHGARLAAMIARAVGRAIFACPAAAGCVDDADRVVRAA